MRNKICGIYIIENIKTKKIYIGQSTDINRRFSNHKYELKNNIHNNKYIQHSWNKYGESFFSFKILCSCNINELNEKERYFIKKYDSYKNGFNNTEDGQDSEVIKNNGYKLAKFIEQKRKISKNNCLECGRETESGYHRYCENHRHKCRRCGERFGLQNSKVTCSTCLNKHAIKKCSICKKEINISSNRRKYCAECSQITRKEKQKMLMRKRREKIIL